jgi:hypothetical protein
VGPSRPAPLLAVPRHSRSSTGPYRRRIGGRIPPRGVGGSVGRSYRGVSRDGKETEGEGKEGERRVEVSRSPPGRCGGLLCSLRFGLPPSLSLSPALCCACRVAFWL